MTLSRLVAGLAASLAAILLAIVRPAPLPAVDWLVYDALVRRVPDAAPPPLAAGVVAVDEASLSAVGQWPWSRDVIAQLLARLRELGASVVAFDVLFAEPDARTPQADERLAAAMSGAPVVLGHAFVFDGAGPGASCVLHAADLIERQRGDRPPHAGLFEAAGSVCTVPVLARAAADTGFVNATPDPDGRLRRLPLLVRQGDAVYPSLPLAAVRRATGGAPLVLDARSDGSLLLTVGTRRIAVDDRGRLLVRHPRASKDEPIPAIDVLERRVAADRIRGRIVFVGATALGMRDSVTTATAHALPGVALHAAVADTLMSGVTFERPEFGALAEVSAAAAAAVLLVVTLARGGVVAGALAGLIFTAAAWFAASLLLSRWSQFVSPLWTWVSIGLTVLVHGALTIRGERRRADRERRRRADAQRLIVQGLTTLTETRDVSTGHHARRTQELTSLLATALARRPAYRRQLPPDRIALIATLAPLHDIGKVGVRDAVLRKPGALTPEERAEIRRHPVLGHDALERAEALAGVHDDEVIALAKEIVYTHHERWDGSGYPRGLRGSAIPLPGRLVALVDAYDALVSDRPYSAARSHEDAVETIAGERGRHFDPDVVDAFLNVHEQFRAAAAR